MPESFSSSILNNHNYGTVGQFINDRINENPKLSIVSAFFTIHAYNALKRELEKIEAFKFLYGVPSFTGSVEPSKGSKKNL